MSAALAKAQTDFIHKAPHHSANSWTSHWSINREYYDLYIPQIIDARRGAEDSGSEVETDSSDDDSSSYSSDEDTDSEDDVQNMSAAGEMINDADRRVAARYIASVGVEWNHLRSRERWEPVENMVSVDRVLCDCPLTPEFYSTHNVIAKRGQKCIVTIQKACVIVYVYVFLQLTT